MEVFFDNALLVAYAGVMVLLGLSLEISDFRNIFRQPKAVLTGLVCQMLMLPALAFLLVSIFPLPDHLKTGFILLSACPGGSTSNLASYMLRGNVALSVSMTALNSFLVVFSVPLVLALGAWLMGMKSGDARVPFGETMINILLLVVLPCAAGILIRAKWSPQARKMEGIFKYIMPVLLAAAIVGVAFVGKSEGPGVKIADYLDALLPALLLNITSMVAGYFISRLVGLSLRDRFTIGIEVGIQNAALAITIASGALFFNNPQIAVPAIVYLLFPFFTALIFGYLANRRELRHSLFHKPDETR
ncbi:MAG: bile acid:sodium symporter family protein [Bacteroidia bacterium]|nr:bile acid:sodium symporter family protein [Bacteroidia bacterium]